MQESLSDVIHDIKSLTLAQWFLVSVICVAGLIFLTALVDIYCNYKLKREQTKQDGHDQEPI